MSIFYNKRKTVTLSNDYTIDTLFEAMQGKQFSAGVPSRIKVLNLELIVFPPLDKNNQIRIYSNYGANRSTKKFSVEKNIPANDTSDLLGSIAMDNITHGFSTFGAKFGDTQKRCQELVDITMKELNGYGI